MLTSLTPDLSYRLGLRIGDISLQLDSFQVWQEEPAFRPFMAATPNPDFRAVFRQADTLPDIPAAVIHEDKCYRVHPAGNGRYLRSFFDAPRDMTPYAVAEYDYDRGEILISCLPKGAHCVSQLHNSFFHIDFEAMLLSRQRLCLHAACVNTVSGGLLFSGPSGIGKSTQADLWCRFRNAKLINGDRPILSRGASGWLAWGSPFAGSSRCHINESCPAAAIVILQQGKQCALEPLKPAEAFRAVWSGLTVHSWDKQYVEEAIQLTMELIGSVPVFRYTCTPDSHAVDYLEQALAAR